MAQTKSSVNGVTASLYAIIEEIDDDDDDVIEVTIEILNESSEDLWDIRGDIRAMDGAHAHPLSAPTRIESGDFGDLTFWVPSDTGAWLFKIDYNTDAGHGVVELGPFTNDLRITPVARAPQQKKGKKKLQQTHGSEGDLLASAFGSALEGFGVEVEASTSELQIDAGSSDPIQAAFAGGLLQSQQTNPTEVIGTPEPNPPSIISQQPPISPPPTNLFTSPSPSSPLGPPSSPPGPPSSPPGPPSSPPGPPSSPPGPPSSPPGPPSSPPGRKGGPPGPPPF
ncbi:MAG: hypothetical protein VYB40_02515 [Candidatus Thermoplasmatota archaeon]|nr:hypothetical protein [Candidatus Thermoplasmatota archaeon]